MKKFFHHFLHPFLLLPPLALRDLKMRFVSSYLGVMWVLVQPVITIIIMWFVFSVGLKVRPVSEVPFILWLIPGYLAWQYFSEGISGGAHSIIESSYLVKKIVFRVELLPLVKIMSGLMIHVAFMVAMVLIYSARGYGLHVLQVGYYMISVTTLIIGLSYITSSLTVFIRDIGQVVGVLLQIGFWGTPIFWEEGMIPSRYRWLVALNPMSYIVEGYRQSLLSGAWPPLGASVRYWLVTLLIMIVGIKLFRALRPHFADVL